MKRLGKKGVAVAVCLAISLCALPAGAENIMTTIGVGDTILEVSGKTSPSAFVTISRDGSVIGTQTAGGAGTFTQTFTAQEPGLHQLHLDAQASGGGDTDTVTATVNVMEHTTTAVYFFLPSTITLRDSTLASGQPLELSGKTAPSAAVTIYVDSSIYATVSSTAQGNWNASILTGMLPVGQHDVFVKVTDSLGAQSYPTSLRAFVIEATPGIIPQPASPKIPRTILITPVITFPGSGAVWSQPNLAVKGRAGANVQVELWDGNKVIASVWSDGRGEWSVSPNFDPGEHVLRARACRERTCSAFSEEVRFTYRPQTAEESLRVAADEYSFSVYEGDLVTIRSSVASGQPPYETTMKWDGHTVKNATYPTDKLEHAHRYSQQGRYSVTLEVKDAQGRAGRAHFSVHVMHRQPLVPWVFLIVLQVLFISTLLVYVHQQYLSGIGNKIYKK